MLEDQGLSWEGVEVGKKIEIDIFWAQKSVVIKIDLTARTLKLALGLHQEAIINQENHLKDDGNGQEYRIGNRPKNVINEESIKNPQSIRNPNSHLIAIPKKTVRVVDKETRSHI